jgi:hypothetical protein
MYRRNVDGCTDDLSGSCVTVIEFTHLPVAIHICVFCRSPQSIKPNNSRMEEPRSLHARPEATLSVSSCSCVAVRPRTLKHRWYAFCRVFARFCLTCLFQLSRYTIARAQNSCWNHLSRYLIACARMKYCPRLPVSFLSNNSLGTRH